MKKYTLIGLKSTQEICLIGIKESNMKILIMAGGSGERFWPLSTKNNPKQLLSLVSDKSMIRETVDRILNLVDINDVFIATNSIQVEGVIRELPELPSRNIIIEPAFRDTAAAIVYGSTYINKYEENPVIIVLAADHLISCVDEFINMLKIAKKEAEKGKIVTLGIKPTRPETGYGYIKVQSTETGMPTKAEKFLEKPKYELAKEYFESRQYVWNSGMFVFKYKTIMDEIEKYKPNHIETIKNMQKFIDLHEGEKLSNLVKPYFNDFERVSIDFAIMEKSNLIQCIPSDIGWNDIGGYNSLEEVFDKDEFGNIIRGSKYVYIDSSNNIIIGENQSKLITSIGLNDMVIVDTKESLLIANRRDTQKIKALLKRIM